MPDPGHSLSLGTCFEWSGSESPLEKSPSVSHPLAPSGTATRSVPAGVPPPRPPAATLTLTGLPRGGWTQWPQHMYPRRGHSFGQLIHVRPRSSAAQETRTAEPFSQESPKLHARGEPQTRDKIRTVRGKTSPSLTM